MIDRETQRARCAATEHRIVPVFDFNAPMSGVEKSVENPEAGVEKGVENSADKTLSYLETHSKATERELSDVTGLSVRGVEKNLKNLKIAGLLQRVGGDRGGHWEVVR